jgi:hypothetical protein
MTRGSGGRQADPRRLGLVSVSAPDLCRFLSLGPILRHLGLVAEGELGAFGGETEEWAQCGRQCGGEPTTLE